VSGFVEVHGRDGAAHLVAAESARRILGDRWTAVAAAYDGRVSVVRIPTIESVSGRGLRSLVGLLR
jgi:hypothetical protein